MIVVVGVLVLTNCTDEEDVIVDEIIEETIPVEMEIKMEFDSILSLSSFQEIPVVSGIYTDDLQLNNGESWNYKLRVPSLESGDTAPLVIGLVWAGQVNDHLSFFDCLLEPSFSQSESYLFVPEDNFGLWSHPRVEQRILEFVDYAIQYWSIHADQIVVAGYSIGGHGAWHYSINHDSIFTAGIPMAALHNIDKKPTIPIYGICGSNDDLTNCSLMESQVLESTSDKSTFNVQQGLSHFEACQYQRSLTNAANWLDNVVFNE